MIPAHIFQRVFRIRNKNGNFGSAYTIENNSKQYLVSASHIFNNDKEKSKLSIFKNDSWKEINVKSVYNGPVDEDDTIVFELPYDISPRYDIGIGPEAIFLGTWTYILGFPLGLAAAHAEHLNYGYPVPFVKAALLSSLGHPSEKKGLRRYFLDGHNNPGFSGGPVIWISPFEITQLKLAQLKIKIIGTISGYFTENIQGDNSATLKSNAGIIVANQNEKMLEQF